MITEDYVSFETAKLLKEKGFNEYCRAFRSPSGNLFYSSHDIKNFEDGKTIGGAIAAPTIQMAMKWLREVHNLEITPFHEMFQGNSWWYRIEKNTSLSLIVEYEEDFIYSSYEQAAEAAIKYCLEHLI